MTASHDVEPRHVLIVEDNRADVRLTEEALREASARCVLHVAVDGVEAMAFLHREGAFARAPRPDLVLLDLNLPRMNGRAVLAAMKGHPDLRRIPVIVLTTSSAEQDVREAYDLHANCYVTKPVDLDDLFRAFRAIEAFWLETAELPRT